MGTMFWQKQHPLLGGQSLTSKEDQLEYTHTQDTTLAKKLHYSAHAQFLQLSGLKQTPVAHREDLKLLAPGGTSAPQQTCLYWILC